MGRRTVVRTLAAALGASVGWACIGGGTFACTDDAHCDGGIDGICEADGWCSFADGDCASGRRYSRWAGDELAGACAPAPLASTSGNDTLADTGTSAVSESSGDGGSSGPPPVHDSDGPACGNAVVEVGEDCDDGNGIDGDGCNDGCVPSGTRVWEMIIAGVGDDHGNGVAAASNGDIYVAGELAVQNGNAWLLRLGPDGAQGWSDNSGGGPPDALHAVALAEDLPDGAQIIEHALFVVGYTTPYDNPDELPPPPGENHLVRRYDDAGAGPAQDWNVTYNSAQNGDDRVNDVAIAPTLDGVVVFGLARDGVDGVDADAVVRAFPSGSSNDTWFFTSGVDGGADDVATAGVIDDDGLVWAVGTRTKAGGDVDAWIAHIAVSGDPPVATREWTAFVDMAGRDDRFNDVALDPGGLLVAVGQRGSRAWIAAWLRDTDPGAGADAPQWQLEPPDMPADAELHALAFDGRGALVLVGAVETADHGRDAWIHKLEPDLSQTVWSVTVDGSAHGDDIARAVSIGPEDRVVVVGDRLELAPADLEDGEDRDVWVAVHLP